MQLNNIQLPQTTANAQNLLFVQTPQEQQHLAAQQSGARPGKKIKSEMSPGSPYSLLPADPTSWHSGAGLQPNADPNVLPNFDPNSLLTLSPPSLSPPPTEPPPAALQAEQLLFDHEQGSPVSYSASGDFGTVTDNDLISIMTFME